MYEKNIFINCPFDNPYFPKLKALLFTIIYCWFEPQISETTNSGQNRLENIVNLISKSKYSIHDLSRMELSKSSGLPRFNMPFECGIDFGFKYGNNKYKEKRFLILDEDKYRIKRVMSDIWGNDIQSHDNSDEKLVQVVRNWIKIIEPTVKHKNEIWLAYIEFDSDYKDIWKKEWYDHKKIDAIPFCEIIEWIKTWQEVFKENLKKNNIW